MPVDEVLIALPAKSCYEQIQTAIAVCERGGVEAKYLSDFFQVYLPGQSSSYTRSPTSSVSRLCRTIIGCP